MWLSLESSSTRTVKPIFIAEIKPVSPFGYHSPYPFNRLMDYALEYGDWISVHDNALWGGDYNTISFVRKYTDKPILAKGIHSTDGDIQRAIDHGANYVLVVDRIPHIDYCNQTLFEFNSFDHANTRNIPDSIPQKIKSSKYVCNRRDLRTGKKKEVDELELYLKAGVWVCQASGIKTPDDVNPNVNAFIVGTNLVEFCKQL